MPDFRPSFLQGLALGSAFRLSLPREAMRGLGGARAGAAAGSSLDFLDFREYHPGAASTGPSTRAPTARS